MEMIELSKKERTWGMFAHLSSLLGWIGIPFGNLIAPFIIWQIKKEDMDFAANQAKECLNFQISMVIYIFIAGILCFFLIGFVLLPILIILDIVFTIIAAVKVNDGHPYRYPLTLRFVV
jgi:uncharacterized Tic20 family protein